MYRRDLLQHSIEQLDMAAAELVIKDPLHARLALILTDNIVELMLHDQCEAEIAIDGHRTFLHKPKYSPSVRRCALGRSFPKKIEFCLKAGRIVESDARFIAIGHRYRNKVYHQGIVHNDILYSVAWEYHQRACDLFGRLRRFMYVLFSAAEVSTIVTKHVGPDGWGIGRSDSLLHDIGCSLQRAKPPLADALQIVLSNSMGHRLERLNSMLLFLVENNPGKQKKQELIRWMQFYEFLHRSNSRDVQQLHWARSPRTYKNLLDSLDRKFRPRILRDPIPFWRRRANLLRDIGDPLEALEAFERLRSDMGLLDRLIREAASELDAYIDSQRS